VPAERNSAGTGGNGKCGSDGDYYTRRQHRFSHEQVTGGREHRCGVRGVTTWKCGLRFATTKRDGGATAAVDSFHRMMSCYGAE
jgi:hypothetical protein